MMPEMVFIRARVRSVSGEVTRMPAIISCISRSGVISRRSSPGRMLGWDASQMPGTNSTSRLPPSNRKSNVSPCAIAHQAAPHSPRLSSNQGQSPQNRYPRITAITIQPPTSNGGQLVGQPVPRVWSPRTLRTGSAQIGQLSVNGPTGPYPQLGHVLAMVLLNAVSEGNNLPEELTAAAGNRYGKLR